MEIYLSKNLAYFRHKKGESQAKTAIGLGLKRTTYVNYEVGNNDPDLRTIASISIKLGVTIDDLLLKDLSEGNLMTNQEEVEKRNLKRNLKGNLYGEKSSSLHVTNDPHVEYGLADDRLKTCEEKGSLKDKIIEALEGQIAALKLVKTHVSQ